MTDADAVRRVALALPRSYEVQVRGRWKFRVKQIVYCAFSRDEKDMGFGFPKAERDGLIASDPETFFLPPTSDLRYQWVCAHLDRLDDEEMREFVIDAWRMCVPKMLHELPELPAPAAEVWNLVEQQEWGELRPLLHPVRPVRRPRHRRPWPEPAARPPARRTHPSTAGRRRGPRRTALSLDRPHALNRGFWRCESGVLVIVRRHNPRLDPPQLPIRPGVRNLVNLVGRPTILP